MIAFPRTRLASLTDLAAAVLERRGAAADNVTLARDALSGFADVCTRAGLDSVLTQVDVDDALLHEDLVARLGDKAQFDPRGPRNAKPKQLADCLVAVLQLEPVDPPERNLTLTAELRGEVVKALASVIDVELQPDKLRDTIIASGRAACDEAHLKSFDRSASKLDDKLRVPQHLKIPLDGVQAVQRALSDARTKVVRAAVGAALDRAKATIAEHSREAAERFDAPVSHELTPRDIVVRRVLDPHSPRATDAVVQIIFETLSESAALVWPAPTVVAVPYAVSRTFLVGEVIEHPKFGRGTVKATAIQRMDVEFAEGTHTLVHARK